MNGRISIFGILGCLFLNSCGRPTALQVSNNDGAIPTSNSDRLSATESTTSASGGGTSTTSGTSAAASGFPAATAYTSLNFFQCLNGGALGTSPNFCGYALQAQFWTLGTGPVTLVAPGAAASADQVMTLTQCVNGGALGTSPNFCGYWAISHVNWDSLGTSPVQVLIPTAAAPCESLGLGTLTLYVCENGGEIGTSPNFCSYLPVFGMDSRGVGSFQVCTQ